MKMKKQQKLLPLPFFAMGPAKNRPSVTKFVKRLENILGISLPPALPRKAALSLAAWISGAVYWVMAIAQNCAKIGRKELDCVNRWKNLNQVLWKRLLYLSL